MISIKEHHYQIVKNVLAKYPYTFYAFGSRTKNKSKSLSDLDLCFFEDIPWNIRAHIDEDFEESDLPYKVDVIDWNMCDQDFRNMIQKDLTCIQASKHFLKVEENLFGHFIYLPKKIKFHITEKKDVTIVNCSLNSSMFNIVCKSNIQETDFEIIKKYILEIIEKFKGQPFAWWLGPSTTPKNLKQVLQDLGFIQETTEYAMICNLNQFTHKKDINSNLDIRLAQINNDLNDFISVVELHNPKSRSFFEKVTNLDTIDKQKFFIGYEEDKPVVISRLYLQGDTVGIFTLITQKDKRRKGYGTHMMNHILNYAKQRNFSYATLSASSDSGFKIYKNLGFKTVGLFECYEK